MLQCRVGVAQNVVGAETIPKSEMIPPEGAVNGREVHMIRAGIPTSEELAPRDSLLSAMNIVSTCEDTDVSRHGRAFGIAGENVQNGLRRQTRNRGASRVLQ